MKEYSLGKIITFDKKSVKTCAISNQLVDNTQ
jgi:hypothetical protein